MTKEFSGLVSTELKLFSREPMLIFVIFIRPAILLFLIMVFIIPAGNIPKDVAINEVVPAIIILNVAMVAIFNIPASAASYREIKFFKRLRATPVSSLTILSTLAAANFITCILGILPLILIGILIYQAEFEGCVLTFTIGFLVVFLSLISFFLVIASTCSNSRSAMGISILILLPVMFFSGIFIPLEMLPDWIVDYIAPLVPATYAVKLLQGLWVGKPLLDFSREIILLSVFFIAI